MWFYSFILCQWYTGTHASTQTSTHSISLFKSFNIFFFVSLSLALSKAPVSKLPMPLWPEKWNFLDWLNDMKEWTMEWTERAQKKRNCCRQFRMRAMHDEYAVSWRGKKMVMRLCSVVCRGGRSCDKCWMSFKSCMTLNLCAGGRNMRDWWLVTISSFHYTQENGAVKAIAAKSFVYVQYYLKWILS